MNAIAPEGNQNIAYPFKFCYEFNEFLYFDSTMVENLIFGVMFFRKRHIYNCLSHDYHILNLIKHVIIG